MISSIAQSGHTTYGLKEFVIDTEADLENLPIDIPMGSTALCIKSGDVYMLNGSGDWKKF